MNFIPSLFLGVGFIIVCCGVVKWINTFIESKYGEDSATGGKAEQIDRRLDEVEKRLSDVLDVMIALSEKFDRWEGEEQPKIPSSV